MKSFIFAAMAIVLPIGAGAQEMPASVQQDHSVKWFMDHPDERDEVINWCNLQSPLAQPMPNCATAFGAAANVEAQKAKELERQVDAERKRMGQQQ